MHGLASALVLVIFLGSILWLVALGLLLIVMRLDIHYRVLQLNAAIQMKLFPSDREELPKL